MKNKLRQFITWIQFQYNTIWNTIHFWNMKRKAEKLHKLTGKQYFVVPKTKSSLMIVNNDYIKYYNQMASKQKGIKKITFPDLLKMCYYKTSSGTYNR